ncbi:MAG: PaaI family thioesterase, partial [Solirubrobacteraceae bacterium]
MTDEISPSIIASPYAEDLAVVLQRSEAGVGVALPFEERNTMHGVLHGGALASLVPISSFAAIH